MTDRMLCEVIAAN